MSADATEWRQIPGYPNYSVSDDGQVRNDSRGGRALTVAPNTTGYPEVSIDQKHHRVHRLMMSAFVGPSAELVRHLDDVKTNNVLPNLAYGDMHDNAMDIVNRGTHHYASRTHCSRGHLYTEESTGSKTSPNGRQARVCRICRTEDRRANGATERAPSTCPWGHLFDEENTYTTTGGSRQCRACNRLRQQARNAGIGFTAFMSNRRSSHV